MQEYDFIVVGGGSAGCVLANRLSADSRNRVLLLEAGNSDWNPMIRVPLMAGVLYTLPSLNWGYDTEPQAALQQRRIHWPRGKVLGGSSAINGMVYIRGHARDYDTWRQLGLAGWSFADVLPYFLRSEDHLDRRDGFHGFGGPLAVRRATLDHPLYDAFFSACEGIGLTPTSDFNGVRQEGFGGHDFTIRNGRRHSAAAAFLHPASRRPNLHVSVRSRATRIRFDGRRAVGVDYVRGTAPASARARQEVILAGGTVNSPQLLMASGVGPAAHLAGLGISIVHDLPGVGENLQDHLGVFLQHECLEPITLYRLFRPDRALRAFVQAALFGTGPAATIPLEGCAFIRSLPELDVPDIKCAIVPGLSLEATQAKQGRHGYQITVHQLRPESRGRITLRSADPAEKPVIDPNYLSAPLDVATMTNAVKIIRRIFAQNSFERFRGEELTPGPHVRTDAEITDWIRSAARTVFHPVGTCRMGIDAMAVVSAELKVHGCEGLRVVDASVMPRITSGNTNAPTIMIAEKGSAMILGEKPLTAIENP